MARLTGFLDRNGRYYARLVVPLELRPYLDGKSELRTALGGDRSEAKRKHPRAIADLQDKLDEARSQKVASEALEEARLARRHAPLTPDEIARTHYREELALDDAERAYPERELITDTRWTLPARLEALRRVASGMSSNEEAAALVEWAIEEYRRRGNTDAAFGTTKWRAFAMTLARVELEVIARQGERDEAIFDGRPKMRALTVDDADPEPEVVLTFSDIIDAEERRRNAGRDAKGMPPRTAEKYRREAQAFADFRKSDNAATVTAEEGAAWVADLLEKAEWSNRTISNAIANVRTVVTWGMKQNPKLFPALNPLATVERPGYSTVPSDERTFTMEEARAILKAAKAETRPLYRWVPWLCAYSGARISEIAQLRPEDFFEIDGSWFYRITTSGGRTVKTTSSIRRVPLHSILVKEGFLDHVAATAQGKTIFTKWAQQRIGEWIRETVGITREHLAPNHSWRHLFEDLCTVAGVSDDARAYITGRATGSSRDNYGRSEAALPGLAREMSKVGDLLR